MRSQRVSKNASSMISSAPRSGLMSQAKGGDRCVFLSFRAARSSRQWTRASEQRTAASRTCPSIAARVCP
ncbi:hypothetical protein EXIGLDRAFT_344969 [Exidia glandulosa HHB12029]|uniref:Uncharacterized protein n=1 Tax=Exidia glandulosa HHB12029 TaxID=1314781 RepID=A0A165CGZ1_EXIGL|nr:hypothetical protein EXIGLDRAFT_344969 [Exidia glandulosa HHB12029]